MNRLILVLSLVLGFGCVTTPEEGEGLYLALARTRVMEPGDTFAVSRLFNDSEETYLYRLKELRSPVIGMTSRPIRCCGRGPVFRCSLSLITTLGSIEAHGANSSRYRPAPFERSWFGPAGTVGPSKLLSQSRTWLGRNSMLWAPS
ncbi:MAG: hypothetical protein ACI8QS_002007 [Planctomycetota bacterium]|jgi:hypothetical protein